MAWDDLRLLPDPFRSAGLPGPLREEARSPRRGPACKGSDLSHLGSPAVHSEPEPGRAGIPAGPAAEAGGAVPDSRDRNGGLYDLQDRDGFRQPEKTEKVGKQTGQAPANDQFY